MLSKYLNKFSSDLAIDLGTSNTLISTKDGGIVVNEPSVVAINIRTEQILAVGSEAQKMLGKTPSYINALHPLVDGVISDFEATEKMLKYFINKASEKTMTKFFKPRVIVSVPLDVTEVEKKAVEDAAFSAGAREVYLIEGVVAAAIGAELPIDTASGCMVIGLGGGTTEIAVLSLGGVVTWKSSNHAGNEMNRNIIQFAKDKLNLLLGEKTAEQIKIVIGSAIETEDNTEVEIRGRDLVTGLPKEAKISTNDVVAALSRNIHTIIDDIKSTLEITPPELASDIYERGIILCGGVANLRNLDKVISKAIRIPVRIPPDPTTSVVRGASAVLENDDLLNEFAAQSEDNY